MKEQTHNPNIALQSNKIFLFFFFLQSFKQMIASCLVKDPSKRPSAHKLLKHTFFKQARSNDYIVRTLLEGLPALGDRIKAQKVSFESLIDLSFCFSVIYTSNFIYLSVYCFANHRGKKKICLHNSKWWMRRGRRCHRFEF